MPSLVFLLSLLSSALATLVNITIDDTFGDPVTGQQFSYTPPTSWNVGQSCQTCTARPDLNSTFDHTWHDGTFNPLPGSNDNPNQPIFASVQFNGSAVYVYCILAHTSTNPDGNSDMTFFIDNQVVGTFSLAPTGDQQYDYNVPVFANPSIPVGLHTLTVQTGHVNGSTSLMLLDYVVYTTEQNNTAPTSATPSPSPNVTFPHSTIYLSSTSSTSSSSSPSEFVSSPPSSSATIPATSSAAATAALVTHSSPDSKKYSVLLIVGILVGLIALALIAAALVLYRRRRRRRRSPAAQPFVSPIPLRLDAAPADFMISRQGLLSVPEQDGSSSVGASLSPSSSFRHPYGVTQTRQVVYEGTPPYSDNPTPSEQSSQADPEAFGADANSLIDAPPAYDPNSQPNSRWSRKVG